MQLSISPRISYTNADAETLGAAGDRQKALGFNHRRTNGTWITRREAGDATLHNVNDLHLRKWQFRL